jgi:hypothetical protein
MYACNVILSCRTVVGEWQTRDGFCDRMAYTLSFLTQQPSSQKRPRHHIKPNKIAHLHLHLYFSPPTHHPTPFPLSTFHVAVVSLPNSLPQRSIPAVPTNPQATPRLELVFQVTRRRHVPARSRSLPRRLGRRLLDVACVREGVEGGRSIKQTWGDEKGRRNTY